MVAAAGVRVAVTLTTTRFAFIDAFAVVAGYAGCVVAAIPIIAVILV